MYNSELYAPPPWSLKKVGDADWNVRAKEVRVYAPADVSTEDLKAVVAEREPVNIGFSRHYTPPRESGYTRVFEETGQLPPNFALYMHALVSQQSKKLVEPGTYHVINSIGYRFDSLDQPDYKYFFDHNDNIPLEKEQELVDRLTMTFKLAFQCAVDIEVRKICLCYLGGVAFAKYFPPNQRAYMNVYFAALDSALTFSYLEQLDEIDLMGCSVGNLLMAEVGERFKDLIQDKGKACRLRGDIPGILEPDTLYMNAWDPHSVVGNGNEGDRSLDGYFGRLSDMGYMSIPDINPCVLQNIRRVRS
jgi:hypothetical protein